MRGPTSTVTITRMLPALGSNSGACRLATSRVSCAPLLRARALMIRLAPPPCSSSCVMALHVRGVLVAPAPRSWSRATRGLARPPPGALLDQAARTADAARPCPASPLARARLCDPHRALAARPSRAPAAAAASGPLPCRREPHAPPSPPASSRPCLRASFAVLRLAASSAAVSPASAVAPPPRLRDRSGRAAAASSMRWTCAARSRTTEWAAPASASGPRAARPAAPPALQRRGGVLARLLAFERTARRCFENGAALALDLCPANRRDAISSDQHRADDVALLGRPPPRGAPSRRDLIAELRGRRPNPAHRLGRRLAAPAAAAAAARRQPHRRRAAGDRRELDSSTCRVFSRRRVRLALTPPSWRRPHWLKLGRGGGGDNCLAAALRRPTSLASSLRPLHAALALRRRGGRAARTRR